MTEQHVVELVHHQHRQVLVGAAARGNERGIDQHARARADGHRGGGHVVADLDRQQVQQLAERRVPQGNALPHAVGQHAVLKVAQRSLGIAIDDPLRR